MTKKSTVDKLFDDAFLPTASRKGVKQHLALQLSDKEQAYVKKLVRGLDFNDLHYGDLPKEMRMAKKQTVKKEESHSTPRGIWREVKERKRIYYWSATDFLELNEVSKVKVSHSGTHYVTCKDCSASSNIRHIIVAPGWRYVKLEMDDWTF